MKDELDEILAELQTGYLSPVSAKQKIANLAMDFVNLLYEKLKTDAYYGWNNKSKNEYKINRSFAKPTYKQIIDKFAQVYERGSSFSSTIVERTKKEEFDISWGAVLKQGYFYSLEQTISRGRTPSKMEDWENFLVSCLLTSNWNSPDYFTSNKYSVLYLWEGAVKEVQAQKEKGKDLKIPSWAKWLSTTYPHIQVQMFRYFRQNVINFILEILRQTIATAIVKQNTPVMDLTEDSDGTLIGKSLEDAKQIANTLISVNYERTTNRGFVYTYYPFGLKKTIKIYDDFTDAFEYFEENPDKEPSFTSAAKIRKKTATQGTLGKKTTTTSSTKSTRPKTQTKSQQVSTASLNRPFKDRLILLSATDNEFVTAFQTLVSKLTN